MITAIGWEFTTPPLGQTIHNIFDADGQRIAEYLFDDTTGTSSLIREYIWANGALAGGY